jgi:hypothetical protein
MALLDGRCAVLATLEPESLESFAGADRIAARPAVSGRPIGKPGSPIDSGL